jgi:hypothetical protein
LKPREWSQAVEDTGKASPFIGEVLEVAFSKAQAVVVLMTPDDEAWLRPDFRNPNDPPYETELTPQARPNVLFEAGMAMGYAADRTVLVEIGNLRPFRDISGRHIIRNNTSARRQELAQRLSTAGCQTDLSGTDWHKEGNFNLKFSDRPVTSFKSVKVASRKRTVGICKVSYPQVTGLPNSFVEARINTFLRRQFLPEQEENEQWEDSEAIYNITKEKEADVLENDTSHIFPDPEEEVTFSTTLNRDGILSITYNYYHTGGAHPIHGGRAFTIELESGYVFNFEDLFKADSHYLPVINNLIFKALKTEEIYNGFQEKKEYDFHLTKTHLVIFNIFEIHALQAFVTRIKPSEIAYIINPGGPLQTLLKK